VQREAVRAAAEAITRVARHQQVVVTHGSAPQVGLLSLQSTLFPAVEGYPLDALGAESEGLLGYLVQQELANQLRDQEVVTLLTQVVVDAADPAFSAPTKRVGPSLAEVDASRLTRDHRWVVVPEGRGFRRVVPSPEPLAIVELRTIRRLVAAGVVVVCAGGGGIPVALDETGAIRGVEAVIDKDRSAALLAAVLGADLLLFLTDVPAVVGEWGTGFARPLHYATPAQLRTLSFPPESMGAKVTAAIRFVEGTGKRAVIGAVPDTARLVDGQTGTQVSLEPRVDPWYTAGECGEALLTAWKDGRSPG
jgi:carbamate kinase